MWKASAGHSVSVNVPKASDDDDWDTDPNFVNDVSEKEQRWGSKSVEGTGKPPPAAKMDDIRSKAINTNETTTKEQYHSKGTFAQGYGGKFGVQTDRMDKSAVGYDDMTAPKPSHSSVSKYQKPEVTKKDIRSKFENIANEIEQERNARAMKEKEERDRAKADQARRDADERERQRREEEERAAAADTAAAAVVVEEEVSYEQPQESYEQPQESYEQPQESYEQPQEEASYQQEETYQQEEASYEQPDQSASTGAAGGVTATSVYDYEATGEDELGFPENVVICNIEFIDDGWWRGEYEGRVGIFPANYVQLNQ